MTRLKLVLPEHGVTRLELVWVVGEQGVLQCTLSGALASLQGLSALFYIGETLLGLGTY